MTALLIDGNALSKTLRAQAAERAAALTARGHQPGLAVILVGANPASEVYVRNKIKACEDNGFFSLKDAYPATLSEADLLARIDELRKAIATLGFALVIIGVLLFTWNEFLFALMLTGPRTRTVPVALARTLQGERGVDWGVLAAIETLYVLPVLIVAMSLQKYLLRGLTFGAVRR